jgi:hypothetical protein
MNNMNNTGLMMMNNAPPSSSANGAPPAGPAADNNNAPPAGAQSDHNSDPILARLKQLEEVNATFQSALEQSKADLKQRDERIDFLSADKRKEMQELIDSGIEKWLSSLTGVSEASKKQFKSGVQDIAQKADVTNAAWEIVCNASQTHETNVKEIDRLIQLDQSNQKLINELRGFRSEASRIGTASHLPASLPKRDAADDAFARNVRSRGNDTSVADTPLAATGPRDAWSDFASMMSQEYRTNYYR